MHWNTKGANHTHTPIAWRNSIPITRPQCEEEYLLLHSVLHSEANWLDTADKCNEAADTKRSNIIVSRWTGAGRGVILRYLAMLYPQPLTSPSQCPSRPVLPHAPPTLDRNHGYPLPSSTSSDKSTRGRVAFVLRNCSNTFSRKPRTLA